MFVRIAYEDTLASLLKIYDWVGLHAILAGKQTLDSEDMLKQTWKCPKIYIF